MADSHVVSALKEKRARLAGELISTRVKAIALQTDLDHVDACLRVFRAGIDPAQIEPQPGELTCVSTVDGSFSCLLNHPNSEDNAQYAEYDLEAQQGMAEWAFAMFAAAAFTVIMTGAGVLLIWRTLAHTRRAANAAENAVTAARKSTDKTIYHMAKHSRRELRSYIFIDEPRRERRSPQDPWTIQFFIKNFGQTPAYNVKMHAGKRLVDANRAAHFKPGDFQTETVPNDIGPGHSLGFITELRELSDPQAWLSLKIERRSCLCGAESISKMFLGTPAGSPSACTKTEVIC